MGTINDFIANTLGTGPHTTPAIAAIAKPKSPPKKKRKTAAKKKPAVKTSAPKTKNADNA